MPVQPVSPVNASVASVGIGRTYDAVRRADGFDAVPGSPRAKVWRSYRKGGSKKTFAQQQRRRSVREETETFLAAGGTVLLNEANRNEARSKERSRERSQRVQSAGVLSGDGQPQPAGWRENTERRADEQRVRAEQKTGATPGQEDRRSASERKMEAARYSAKLVAARETIKALHNDVLYRAANAPLALVPEITAILGVDPKDIHRICAEEWQKLIRPPINMVNAVSVQQPDEEKTLGGFEELVTHAAAQNERGVVPSTAIHNGVERVGTRALFMAALSLIRTWRGPGSLATLPVR